LTLKGRKTIIVKVVHTHELFLDELDDFYEEHICIEGIVYLIDHHDVKKIDLFGHVTTWVKNLPDKKLSQLFVGPTHYLSGINLDKDETNGDFWILENSVTNEVRVERITKDGKRIVY